MSEELLTIAKEFKKLSTSEKIYLITFLATLSIWIFPWIWFFGFFL
jgi:cell division protein FtsL